MGCRVHAESAGILPLYIFIPGAVDPDPSFTVGGGEAYYFFERSFQALISGALRVWHHTHILRPRVFQ